MTLLRKRKSAVSLNSVKEALMAVATRPDGHGLFSSSFAFS